MELEAGQVAVVTGAASGIGLALAERFAHAGLRVVLADVEAPALASAADRIGALGVEALAVHTDVSDSAAVETLASPQLALRVRAKHSCATTPVLAAFSGALDRRGRGRLVS